VPRITVGCVVRLVGEAFSSVSTTLSERNRNSEGRSSSEIEAAEGEWVPLGLHMPALFEGYDMVVACGADVRWQ